jgi:PAS domain S-box-containing protein
MSEENLTREELISEIRHLRQHIEELEEAKNRDHAQSASVRDVNSYVTDAGVLMVESDAFRKMFKAHGAVMYVVDLETFRIIDANDAALKFYGYDFETMVTKRIPDLNTTPENEIREEIKQAVAEGRSYYIFKHQLANGEIRDVEIYANPILIQGKEYSFSVVHDISEKVQFEEDRERLIKELKTALDEIKTLHGIIPICSFCKRIRDDRGYWNNVEVYVKEHSEAILSHSLCPSCARKQYPDIYNK